MVNYKKHLSEPWFSLVMLGIKTAEGRLNKGDFAKMNVGDTITFFNDDFNHREFTITITNITRFRSFETYLRKETLKRCLPSIKSLKDGLSVYYKYFTKAQEQQYGIVCVHMSV